MKIFYIFRCPLGANDSKIGITGHPDVRLGVYQNSYSAKSHLAQFDIVYTGKPRHLESLEKQVKLIFKKDIEDDGRGHTEWVSGYTPEKIAKRVDELIEGFHFHIKRLPKKYLPVNMANLEKLLADYSTEQQT